MLLLNNFTHDSRVEREAATLATEGYEVTVLAVMYGPVQALEKRDGITIKRIGPAWLVSPFVTKLLYGLFVLLTTPWLITKWLYERAQAPLRFMARWARHLGALAELHGTALLRRLRAFYGRHRPRGSERGPWRYLAQQIRRTGQQLRELSRMLWYRIAAGARAGRRPIARLKCRMAGLLRRTKSRAWNLFVRWLKDTTKNVLSLELARVAFRERADIYHAHDLNTLFPAYIAARLTGARLVYDSHELWSGRNVAGGLSASEKRRTIRLEGFLIRRVDAAITVCQAIARELAEMYGIPEPHVIRNCPHYVGEPLHPDRAGTRIPRRGDQKILLYLGRITFNRGLETLLGALSALPEFDLVMMGNGDPRYIRTLMERASELDVAQRVHLVDAVPYNEVAATAAEADLGVVLLQNSCLSYYYSLPTKLFECIQAGLPVIVSNFPELLKVIKEYDVGVACDPSDPRAIVKAVKEIFSDPARFQRMRRNARLAARELNWESEGRKLVEVYRSLSNLQGRKG